MGAMFTCKTHRAHRHQSRRFLRLAVGIAPLFCGAADCLAGPFSFLNYVDSTGSLSAFSVPSMNNNLQVAFNAAVPGQGTGVFRYDANSGTTIFQSDSNLSVNSGPSIANAGTVMFAGFHGDINFSYTTGIYVGTGGSITAVATRTNEGLGSPYMSPGGHYVY